MDIEIFQICYTKELLNNIPESFSALDNSENLRPDWREYWPIRNYLLENELETNKLYGFLSPKFKYKTSLSHKIIDNFIKNNYQGEDLVSFSPFWDLSSFFINSIEQGEFFQPGFYGAFEQFSNHISCNNILLKMPSPMERTVFSNFFLGTKSFWIKWLEIGEKLFDLCENGNSLQNNLLLSKTPYENSNLPMKIFVQERITDLLLILDHNIKNLAFDSFLLSSSITAFNEYKNELIICNSLKNSFFNTNKHIYFNSLVDYRIELIKKMILDHPILYGRFKNMIDNFQI